MDGQDRLPSGSSLITQTELASLGLPVCHLPPLTDVRPTWEAPTIVNNTLFPGAPWAGLGLYFLCLSQALTCLPPENTMTCTIGMVIKDLQVFKKILAQLQGSLRNEAISRMKPGSLFFTLIIFHNYPQKGNHPIGIDGMKPVPDFS